MIVLDASALVEYLLMTRRGQVVAEHLTDSVGMVAPELIDLEVAHVLRRGEARGLWTGQRAAEAMDDLQLMVIERFSHLTMLGRIWELRHNLTPYDAAYVALAELVDAPLLTCDVKLANAPGHGAEIQAVL